jgi:transcriptional regulator with XRE-family HTH domain|tara:strand:- start:1778 stop:2527 length:750 start_codon:yes stop_codon:yes gene_type:complete
MEEMLFGKYLRKIREAKQISLRSLAESAEMDPAYLSRLENGKSGAPKLETVEKLASALCEQQGLSMEDCSSLTRRLLVKAGHLQDQEDLIDDLTERFATRLRDEGFPEENIDEALTRISLPTMRAVLLGKEKLEIGSVGSYSNVELRERKDAGEEVVRFASSISPKSRSTDGATSSETTEKSASEYLDHHAEEFTSRRQQRRQTEKHDQPKILSAGNDAQIRVNKKVRKSQEKQLRLIARLIATILEEK